MNTPFNYKRDAKTARPGDIYKPAKYDACQSPLYAMDPVLPYLRPGQTIWEPAAGEGNLVKAMRDNGLTVIDSDILTGQNFFEYEPPAWNVLVTNPPYSIKFEWLERCYELGKPFALLLPVETLGTGTAIRLFERYGLEMILLKQRIDFKMPNAEWSGGGAQFSTFWLTWKLTGQPVTIGEMVKRPPLQPRLFQ